MLTGLRCYPLAIAGRWRFALSALSVGRWAGNAGIGRVRPIPVAPYWEVVDAGSGAVPCIERYLYDFLGSGNESIECRVVRAGSPALVPVPLGLQSAMGPLDEG